ncbi:MAG: transcription-repair coupling factor [Gammaproteobacteria bacterium]|nr:transcription-repair coupling factor [Gammaproteobacteria bacterium]
MEKFNIGLKKSKDKFLYWPVMHGCATALAISLATEEHDGLVVVITPNIATAHNLWRELKFFYTDNEKHLMLFPDRELLPYDVFSPHQELISERLLTMHRLLNAKRGILLVSITTLLDYLPTVDYLQKNSLLLQKNQELNSISFSNILIERGYIKTNQVLAAGDFANRGSILDIFPAGSKTPFRIDLFDNEIDQIYTLDIETQRSIKPIEEIKLLPAKEIPLKEKYLEIFKQKWVTEFGNQTKSSYIYQSIEKKTPFAGIEAYLPMFFEEAATLFDYLPTNSLIIRDDDLPKSIEIAQKETKTRYEELAFDKTRTLLPPHKMQLTGNIFFSKLKQFTQIKIKDGSKPPGFSVKKLPNITINNHEKKPSLTLNEFIKTQKRVLFCADSLGREEILLEKLKPLNLNLQKCQSWQKFIESDIPYGITHATLDSGTIFGDIAIIAESDLCSDLIMQRRMRSKNAKTTNEEQPTLFDTYDINQGDLVIHKEHGIGRYSGLNTITTNGITNDFLTIEYAMGSKLYVPTSDIQQISRYFTADPDKIALEQLGSVKWQKAKEKALRKIRDSAAELLAINAKRAQGIGFSYKPPKELAKFAEEFPFELTIDQAKTIHEIEKDLYSAQTMDRLVCGDVGFGKTEVAMRAAFIAVQNSKQVAVLVPTTLLAQQHLNTFQDRFADWPINIAMLSRLNTQKEQEQTIHKLKEGSIDIVIATHKLLQKNIDFKGLGLLIIDEEHRFGVKQKEKIKALRANIDILSLTATPIPRTLQMSINGIRDLSIMASPPAKRRSIKTFVHESSNALIREGAMREIMRGGQVYFLHNDVASMPRRQEALNKLLPEARIAIAHGQMREKELEQVMRDFYHQRYNLLICSTIIESGIDIPSANTIIIDRADKLGLAQMYQLRGRVGRSHHQAYAYLLTPPIESLGKDAQRRLDAMRAMKDIGSGFSLASFDLDIRGAGEILGEEQSGQIQAIGLNLYLEMLDNAVKTLKSGKDPDSANIFGKDEALVDLHIPAFFSKEYIFDVHTRLTFYQRLASLQTNEQLKDLQVELIDRFGLLPAEAKNIIYISELKIKAKALGIEKISASLTGGYITFNTNTPIKPETIISLIQQQPTTFKLKANNRLTFTQKLDDSNQLITFINNTLNQLGRM